MIYDSLVIGTGPSAEPVLRHLARTDLSVCVIDGKNIFEGNKPTESIQSPPPVNFFSKVSPKLSHPLIQIERFKSEPLPWHPFQVRKQFNTQEFFYVSTLVSGGLSNFWGGGISRWPIYELNKAANIAPNDICKSYDDLENRLNIASFSDLSSISPELSRLVELSTQNSHLKFNATQFLIQNPIGLGSKTRGDSFDQSLIWNSATTNRQLIDKSSNICYIPDLKALSIGANESDPKVWDIICLDQASGTYIKIKAITVLLCAGSIPTARLVYSALRLKGNISLDLLHNRMFLLSAFHAEKGNPKQPSKSNESAYSRLSFPELQWKYCVDDFLFSSGYVITPSFLVNALHDISSSMLPSWLRKNAFKFLQTHASRISFLTCYLPGAQSDVELVLSSNNAARQPLSLATIKQKYCDQVRVNLLSQHSELLQLALQDLNLHPITVHDVNTGADVHYAGTLGSHASGASKQIHLSCIGEALELPGIFPADPSRLNYLSSLPHTFTSMAIVDASMPYIIQKVRELSASSALSRS